MDRTCKHCHKYYARRCLQTNHYDRSENKFRLLSKLFVAGRLQLIRVQATTTTTTKIIVIENVFSMIIIIIYYYFYHLHNHYSIQFNRCLVTCMLNCEGANYKAGTYNTNTYNTNTHNTNTYNTNTDQIHKNETLNRQNTKHGRTKKNRNLNEVLRQSPYSLESVNKLIKNATNQSRTRFNELMGFL